DLAVELEAVDRLDQADRADLLDVLERLAAARVAAGQRTDERQVALDQLFAGARVAEVVVAVEQLAVLLARLLRAGRALRVHPGPLVLSSRTTMPPPSPLSTPNESTTVSRMRRRVSCPGTISPSWRASATFCWLSGPTRVRMRSSPTSKLR